MRIISIHLLNEEGGLKIAYEKDNPFEKPTKQELSILKDGLNNMLPNEDVTADFYDKDYFEGNSVKSGLSDFDNRSKAYAEEHARDRIQKIIEMMENLPDCQSDFKILEIGCAFGHTVDALRLMGYSAYGVDISEYAINKYKQDYKHVGNFKDFRLESIPAQGISLACYETFNLIYGFNLMEHIPELDLRMFIENLRTNLNGNGLAFFTIDPVFGADNSHCTIHSRKWWDKLFAEHGFSPHKEGTEMFEKINGHCYRKI